MVLLKKPLPAAPLPDKQLVRQVVESLAGPLKAYFRYHVDGLENIPEGRAMLVSMHNGGILPVDSFILGVEYHRHFEYERPLHFLAHSMIWEVPYLGELAERVGGVRTNPQAAQSLLEAGLNKLECFPPTHRGIRLDELRAAGKRWVAELAAGRSPGNEQFPHICPAPQS